jgi:hypothetical protein
LAAARCGCQQDRDHGVVEVFDTRAVLEHSVIRIVMRENARTVGVASGNTNSEREVQRQLGVRRHGRVVGGLEAGDEAGSSPKKSTTRIDIPFPLSVMSK